MSLYKKAANASVHISKSREREEVKNDIEILQNGDISTSVLGRPAAATHYHGNAKDLAQTHYNRIQEQKHLVIVEAFSVKLDEPIGHKYRPGDEITGSVLLDTTKTMEICYVEFSVVGYGAAKSKNPLTGTTCTKKRNYLSKTTHMLGNQSSDYRTSVIEPGTYNSKFKFCLPSSLPSSISYIDPRRTFAFLVSYSVRAAVVITNADSIRRHGVLHARKRPILRRKTEFLVMRDFDINLIPNAMWPNKISDEVATGCSVFDRKQFEATAIVERGVYVCGDVVQVSLETEARMAAKVRAIHVELKQTIHIKDYSEPYYGLINAVRTKHVVWCIERKETEEPKSVFHADVPTPPDMLPTDLPDNHLVSVSYKIHFIIHLTHNNAKLLLELPVLFGPSEMIRYPWQRDTGDLPVFNRPTRFPNFVQSRSTSFDGSLNSNTTQKLMDDYRTKRLESDDNDRTKGRESRKVNYADDVITP